MNKESKIIEKLRSLQKWYPSTGDCGPFASEIDWEEDNTHGQWIRLEDIEKIIQEFSAKPMIQDEHPFNCLWPTFEDFWELYDKKVGKKSKIEKKWLKLSQATKEEIMAYIPNYILSQPNKKYRLNPETFFNNDAWENELIFDKLPTVNGQTKEVIEKNLEQVPSSFIDEIRGAY